MTTNNIELTPSTYPPHPDTLIVQALRQLAADPTCHLPLDIALDAAVVIARVATDGTEDGDVETLCEELTAWCPDEDDVELIERHAASLREELSAGRGDISASQPE